MSKILNQHFPSTIILPPHHITYVIIQRSIIYISIYNESLYFFFSAFEQNYQEGLTGGAAGLAGVSGPPSVTKEVPTSLPERNITAQHESRLLEYLLTNYNRHVRPVLNHTKNVTVNVGITLTQIFDMVSIIIFLRFRRFPLFKKF